MAALPAPFDATGVPPWVGEASVAGGQLVPFDQAVVSRLADCKAAIEDFGLAMQGPIIADGQIRRIADAGSRRASDDAGWYVAHETNSGLLFASFGNWRTGEQGRWSSKAEHQWTPADRVDVQRAREDAQRSIERAWQEAAAKAQKLVRECALVEAGHPYLATKKINPSGALKHGNDIVVPVCQPDGTISSCQCIGADGGKRFLPGGKIKGGYFQIGEIGQRIYVAEGFATAATIHGATGEAVFVAFNCGNLMQVVEGLRQKFSQPIVICADDDRWTVGNPGLTKANDVAEAVSDVSVAKPEFASLEGNPTDFNDLAIREGLEAVRSALRLSAAAGEPGHSVIDWAECIGAPPEREWTWQGLLPRGFVSSLYGDGGVGKTLLAQQLASCIVMGMPCLDVPVIRGPVIALFGEDDEAELWRRQAAINQALGIEMADLGDFHAMSGFGLNNVLMSFDRTIGEATPLLKQLSHTAARARPELVIIDNAADTFAGKEVDRVQVNQFLKAGLGSLARDYQCSVLLLAHPSVSGMQQKSGFSGSTAWNNGVRSRLYMERMDPAASDYDADRRFLRLMKANYTQQGDTKELRWQNGVWVPLASQGGFMAHLSAIKKHRIIAKEIARITAGNENLSPNKRAGNYFGKRLMETEAVGRLGIRKEEVARHVDTLLAGGALVIEDYENSRRVYQRLVLTAKGRALLGGDDTNGSTDE